MPRVLVCDDERHIVRLIQVNLERQGYEVEFCSTVNDCLAKLRVGAFDLVVVDSDMPDLIDQVEDEFGGKVRIMRLGKPREPGNLKF